MNREIVRSSLLLLARVVGGGALLVAGVMKLYGDPLAFALSTQSFKLFPDAIIPPMAYFVPSLEIVLGVTLLLGVWGRQSALLAFGLFAAFTLALSSVLLRGLPVDCGCFGDLFGGSNVSWLTILRNSIFLIATGSVALFGTGLFALACERDRG
jgi:uncharacterized membrane protein YphA (DoxX/SURF4 family)